MNRALYFSADDGLTDTKLWMVEDFDFDGIADSCETGAVLADANHSSRVDGFDLVLLAIALSAAVRIVSELSS